MAEVLGIAASGIAVVGLAVKVWSICWKYYSDARDAHSDIGRLMDYITALQTALQSVKDLSEGPGVTKLKASKPLLESISSNLENEFKGLLRVLEPGLVQKTKKRLGRQLKWPLQREDIENTLRLLEQYKTTLMTAMNCDQMMAVIEIGNQIEAQRQSANISRIPCAEGATHNDWLHQHEDRCLQDTRVELRQQILGWCDDPISKCIFWLNGMAGTGKSTISRTIALELAEKRRLAASFFFTRGRGDVSHARKFFTTIASQLASSLPVLRSSISKAIEEHHNIFDQDLHAQWKHLIFNPLKNAEAQSIQLVVVIDALDECDNERDIQLILQLLEEAKNLETIRLRIFVTSRPDAPILDGFCQLSGETYQDFVLHKVQPSTVNHDISIFFQQKLSAVKQKHKLSTPWPDEETVQRLVGKASGLFIYAATIHRFIQENHDPEEQLSIILGETTHDSPALFTQHLDDMYSKLLQYSIISQQNHSHGYKDIGLLFRQIVGSMVVMFDVLPVRNLAELLHVSRRKVSGTLSLLHSVLHVPENYRQPVRIFHLSFRDFLLDPQRCSDSQLQVDAKEAHINLFRNCMKHIFGLQQNICDIPELGILVTDISVNIIQQHIPPHLNYACRYWLDHFQHGSPVEEDTRTIRHFLEQHFLHWLEALSLIGEVSNGVLMVIALEEMLTRKLDAHDPELLKLVYDAKRFILHNRSIIDVAPLQVYYSALFFAPDGSLVRKAYFKPVPWIDIKLEATFNWSSLILTLDGHTHWVRSVVFSPDGKLVASASNDKTIRVCDTLTGKACRVLEGHTDWVRSVAFSPDGKLIASASDDKTVRVWGTFTGKAYGLLKGHTNCITSVVFSPDGKLIGSASNDKTVRLWDISTEKTCKVFEGHTNCINSLVFSPNGNLAASASNDTTVRLWDILTGKACGVLKGHSDWVNSVAFSPDGKLVASASDDKTVRLWDTLTGKACVVLKGHTDTLNSVVFAPDGKLVASASNKTVRLWDALTGKVHGVLKGHTDTINSIVFSPDGKLLGSASTDRTVRLWDVYILTEKTCGVLGDYADSTGVLEGHTNWVNSIVFSPDGKLVASASDDRTVRLWDTTTAKACGVLNGHTDQINFVAFSPDGKLFASASNDTTVRLWKTLRGRLFRVLEGHTNLVTSVVFSPDGKLVASASDDKTVRLWDKFTGKVRAVLEGHTDWANSVVFSPDGRLAASGSSDTTVRIWDILTGKECGLLEGHSHSVRSTVFSPDGKLVASASNDKTVRLWDVTSKTTIAIIDTQEIITNIRISNDGTHIYTNRGLLQLKASIRTRTHVHTTELAKISNSLFVTNQWAKWNMKNLLWIPHDYRLESSAVDGNLFVIGSRSGRVTFMLVDSGALPPAYLQPSATTAAITNCEAENKLEG